jgi:carbon-monoxide dehydrogenase large subunit
LNHDNRFIGRSLKRVEDPKALTGSTCYVDDLKMKYSAYLGIVRSPYGHAKVRTIDFLNLKNTNGIIAFYTADQLSSLVSPIQPVSSPPGQKARPLLPFARGKTRYVGEPVAVVVAESKYVAEDAVDSVLVEYEPLEPLLDAEKSLQSNNLINPEWGTNCVLHFESHGGDPDAAFEKADVIVKNTFRMHRYSGAAMEPRAVAASYEWTRDYLTVWSSTQWPHVLRMFISCALNIPENRIQSIAPDVGGGFGNKEDVYPEDILVPLVSRLIRRPVKWVASRNEDLKTTVHARDQIHHFELAGTSDGTILGIRDRIIADIGAFHILSTGPPMVSLFTYPGPYTISNVGVSLDCVVTSKMAEGAYRGFGMPETTYVLERGIDLLSEQIGIDSGKVRLKNLPRPEMFPYKTVTGSVYDSGNYPACLRKALDLSNYFEISLARKEAAKRGKVFGVGICFYNEAGSFAPAKFMYDSGCINYSGWDTTTVRITKTGKAIVLVGISPHGQGHETTLAQVCADELNLDLRDVSILHGDSNASPYGFGTWGTRSTVACSSMVRAIRTLKAKMRMIAAHMLGSKNQDEIEFFEGIFRVKGNPKRSVTFREVTERAYQGYPLPDGIEPGLEATSNYDPPGLSYSYSANVAFVELDPETGHCFIPKFYVVHDCGRQINPAIVEGQMVGSLAQGIGGTLLEEFKYGEEGELLSSTFMDYLLPTSLDMPGEIVLNHMEIASPFNDGYKGMSEGGCIGAPAAIANAVDDALRQIGGGVVLSTPLTDEYVWKLLRTKRLPKEYEEDKGSLQQMRKEQEIKLASRLA